MVDVKSVTLCTSSGQSGRAFFAAANTPEVEQLESAFCERFTDEEDQERLDFIVASLAGRSEAHCKTILSKHGAYICIFCPDDRCATAMACMVVPSCAVPKMVEEDQRSVFESSWLQVASSCETHADLVGALGCWFRRVFPGKPVPTFVIRDLFDFKD